MTQRYQNGGRSRTEDDLFLSAVNVATDGSKSFHHPCDYRIVGMNVVLEDFEWWGYIMKCFHFGICDHLNDT